jgi:hypothetical protein
VFYLCNLENFVKSYFGARISAAVYAALVADEYDWLIHMKILCLNGFKPRRNIAAKCSATKTKQTYWFGVIKFEPGRGIKTFKPLLLN